MTVNLDTLQRLAEAAKAAGEKPIRSIEWSNTWKGFV